jgi:hypothetical protein
MDTATTTSDTVTTPTSSTVGIAIIRILPRRAAACSAPRQHGIIDDVALQKRAIACAIEQPPECDINEIVVPTRA